MLLTEMDEDNICFRLFDLGHGFPELGSVALDELEAYRGFPPIERDLYFEPTKTLSEYADQARTDRRVMA